MMLNIHQSIRSLSGASLALACVMALSVPSILSASTVVVSNVASAGGADASCLLDAAGNPLAAGSWVRLGYFNTLNEAEIAALALQGTTELLTAFIPFGAPSAVGTGVSGTAGRIEFASDAPLSAPLPGLYAVVFNASSPGQASEVMVLSLPGTVPADDPSGLVGYLALQLENAGLVAGRTSATGFSTVPFLAGFQKWMAARMNADTPPEQLLPGADADGDGIANLVEYALGSAADDAGSRSGPEINRNSNSLRIQFLCRQDDPLLSVIVQTSSSLEAGDWETAVGSPVEIASPPSPAPTGFVWMEQDVPSGDGTLFVRIRVINNP